LCRRSTNAAKNITTKPKSTKPERASNSGELAARFGVGVSVGVAEGVKVDVGDMVGVRVGAAVGVGVLVRVGVGDDVGFGVGGTVGVVVAVATV